VTHRLSESIKYFHARLVETRKTTPGLRIIEKYAVRVGGGLNHRYGLHDAILIKDNHILVAGGIRQAVMQARKMASHTSRIEVEVESLEQLQEALDSGADIIMLDNMDTETMRKAVEMTEGKAVLEASGGITAANLADVARTGVDIISMGALTHSVKALDISLDIVL
jgi:nicotinate-nucleotide pyrophosphorylase (carboxylating)